MTASPPIQSRSLGDWGIGGAPNQKKEKDRQQWLHEPRFSLAFIFLAFSHADPHVSGLPRGMDRHNVGVNTMESVEE